MPRSYNDLDTSYHEALAEIASLRAINKGLIDELEQEAARNTELVAALEGLLEYTDSAFKPVVIARSAVIKARGTGLALRGAMD